MCTSGRTASKGREDLLVVFQPLGLKMTAEIYHQIVSFFDITLNLRDGKFSPYTESRITRVPPATALFGRAIKTKLSEFIEGQQEATLEVNDRNAKMKMKNYANTKTHV